MIKFSSPEPSPDIFEDRVPENEPAPEEAEQDVTVIPEERELTEAEEVAKIVEEEKVLEQKHRDKMFALTKAHTRVLLAKARFETGIS
jgi:hypothetical protein